MFNFSELINQIDFTFVCFVDFGRWPLYKILHLCNFIYMQLSLLSSAIVNQVQIRSCDQPVLSNGSIVSC